MQIDNDGYVKFNASRSEYGAEFKSAGSRSGFVLKKPGTDSIMGSVLMLSNEDFRLGTASHYHIRMDQTGKTYFGNTGDSHFTSSSELAIGATKKLYLDGGSDTYIQEDSANQMAFFTGGAKRFALIGGAGFFSGTVTASHNFSDERLKENIVVIPNALEKVSSLRGITFTRKSDGSSGTGLIAQELEKVLPDAVYKTKTMSDDDDTEYKAITYEVTVGLLVEAIKELKAEIEELKS